MAPGRRFGCSRRKLSMCACTVPYSSAVSALDGSADRKEKRTRRRKGRGVFLGKVILLE